MSDMSDKCPLSCRVYSRQIRLSRDAMAREAIELSIEHLQEKKEPVIEGAHPLPTAT